ncbi:surface antigen BspA-like [Trichomonas vaginalis G3]|uniref:receptor protein-tyrosine kinase n=1 Tax=Trichomonas vaginalis (strain ATCC PRA-98 / G3) TaxID=412133 RepID=A2EQK2_TRIV3|nr:protein kinase a regulatory subunit binding [Trichomonas vaginalis G3]EAY05049.1 surface antigen BspA-like [Trichomonas vaginalis G3]KAI5488967.1 protein kinase a regulatory subunit binding [Trichomonas vaginalis G3]|eukprot:XP_001317272.1 surface antigen BspA-like [Trichomonas vaginalis G3]
MFVYLEFLVIEAIFDFSYTGSSQTKSLEIGYYKLEVWGAQGGGSLNSQSGVGGKGGYSVGYLTLSEATTVYIQVGGVGKGVASGLAEGGYNGGGCAWGTDSNDPAHGGGGGTDIRIKEDSIYSRVIVAGGGGQDAQTGGFGGGLTGSGSYPGTQTSSSYGGDFFQGAHTARDGGGGGGGTVAGSQTKPTGNNEGDTNGGSGGSGYVYTESTAKDYPSECKLTSKYCLTNASTTGGNQQITEPSGTKSTGHSGNGFARITLFDGFVYSQNENEWIVSGFSNNCINNVEIKSTVFGSNVISIGENVFRGQNCIEKVTISETIREIGSNAFESCVNLVTVSFPYPSSLISIGNSAFEHGKIQIMNISHCLNLISFDDCVFKDCYNLQYIYFPPSLKTIGSSCFENCISLKYIDLPYKIRSIGDSCFLSCYSLRYVNIPPTVSAVLQYTFAHTPLEVVRFRAKTTIYGNAFYNCSNLTSVTLSDSSEIMPDAFSLYPNITKIFLSELVTLHENSFSSITPSVFYLGLINICPDQSRIELSKFNLNIVNVQNNYEYDDYAGINVYRM